MPRYFLTERDPDAETLYGVAIPGAKKRRRHDHRAKVARPDEPLVYYFTPRQLVELRANVAAALLKSGRRT